MKTCDLIFKIKAVDKIFFSKLIEKRKALKSNKLGLQKVHN
jgi:hypothetical protein